MHMCGWRILISESQSELNHSVQLVVCAFAVVSKATKQRGLFVMMCMFVSFVFYNTHDQKYRI